ncbi:putative protein-serine/threonine kinase [Medicago truncatula]|uniref:Cyclin-dependent kinase n=1 Tax=Medicago truncatula TaxID=3880 RepID=A0A396JXP4_MEDTR|nr:putative protein-serine/threonine kinase [Medicago truncatula]
MTMAAPGQLNIIESPSRGSCSVDCSEKLEQIGEGTYRCPEQLNKIFDLCGGPDEVNWPGVAKTPCYNQFKPTRPMKRRGKILDSNFDRHALELLEKMLTLDPAQRIPAKGPLDAEYFWIDPLTSDPKSLPKYDSSHEFQTKKKRQRQRQNEENVKRLKMQHPLQDTRLPRFNRVDNMVKCGKVLPTLFMALNQQLLQDIAIIMGSLEVPLVVQDGILLVGTLVRNTIIQIVEVKEGVLVTAVDHILLKGGGHLMGLVDACRNWWWSAWWRWLWSWNSKLSSRWSSIWWIGCWSWESQPTVWLAAVEHFLITDD